MEITRIVEKPLDEHWDTVKLPHPDCSTTSIIPSPVEPRRVDGAHADAARWIREPLVSSVCLLEDNVIRNPEIKLIK